MTDAALRAMFLHVVSPGGVMLLGLGGGRVLPHRGGIHQVSARRFETPRLQTWAGPRPLPCGQRGDALSKGTGLSATVEDTTAPSLAESCQPYGLAGRHEADQRSTIL